MKILFLASAWPTKESEYVGKPFFRKRINLLPKNINFDVYSILPNESIITKTLRSINPKYSLKKLLIKSEIPCDNFVWQFRYYKEKFFAKLKHRKNISAKIETILREAEKIPDINEYTLIHAQYANPNGLLAYRLKQKYGIPYVIKAHGSDIHTLPFKNTKNQVLTVKALESAHKVIFVSYWLLNKAKKLGYSKPNYVVIPNGIEPDLFKPMDKKKIKDELNLGSKVVGFVGNLIPVKRINKFMQIFAKIKRNIPDVQFLIVGSGYLRSRIEDDFTKHKINVKFVGQVSPDRVSYYMNAMDVMILPSRNEGWPCVVLEAHACGVPVVGSSNGGIPEAIDNDNYIVLEGTDFERKFAEKVCEILDNQSINKDILIERAKTFTWHNIVEKEIAIYREIYNKQRN